MDSSACVGFIREMQDKIKFVSGYFFEDNRGFAVLESTPLSFSIVKRELLI